MQLLYIKPYEEAVASDLVRVTVNVIGECHDQITIGIEWRLRHGSLTLRDREIGTLSFLPCR